MLRHALLLWLTLLSAVAYAWPKFAPSAGDPFLATIPWLPQLISLVMFCVGCLMTRAELTELRRRWPTVLAGTALQYTSMPLLAFGVATAFRLPDDLRAGVLIAGCVPGAMASNVLTVLARGHASYSVSLTTAATFLSPLIVPAWLALFLGGSDLADINFQRESAFLTLTVVLPVAGGYALVWLANARQATIRRAAGIVANLAILWLIASIVGQNRARIDFIGGPLIGALALLNVGGYLAGYCGGWAMRLPESMRRALTIEIGMQNAGLGAALALKMFPDDPLAALPPTLYMFGCMFSGTALAQAWSFIPPHETSAPEASVPKTVVQTE